MTKAAHRRKLVGSLIVFSEGESMTIGWELGSGQAGKHGAVVVAESLHNN